PPARHPGANDLRPDSGRTDVRPARVTRRESRLEEVAMSELYHEGNRALQDRFDSRRLADRLADVKVHDRFTPDDRVFIERMDMFFLATADEAGQPTCSYKG